MDVESQLSKTARVKTFSKKTAIYIVLIVEKEFHLPSCPA